MVRRAAAVLLVLAACSGGGGDAGAQLACTSFYRMAADIDLMTSAEQRAAAQDVWDDARLSETPGIADNARAMLQALTDDDMAALRSAVSGMDAACGDVDL